MNERDETDRLIPGAASESPTSPLNKGTLGGCAGILLVLSLPALLFLPLERLSIPAWIGNLIVLLAISAVALGAYLLTQVPSSAAVRPRDPHHPLTSSGRSPILEQPAGRSNRITLLVEYALALSAIIGYGMVSFAGRGAGRITGVLVISAAGYALLILGYLASRRLAAVPAWRWLHVPVQGGVVSQAVPTMGLGLILFVWSLILAVEEIWFLLPFGIGLLAVTALSMYGRHSWHNYPNHTSTP